MTKIDFDRFMLIKSIDGQKKAEMNVRRVFAEELYSRGQGLAFHALALKIYNGDGVQEFNEEECKLMVTFASQCMSPAFLDSLQETIKENGTDLLTI